MIEMTCQPNPYIPERTISFCGHELKRTFHFIEIRKSKKTKSNYKVAVCSNCGKEKNIAW